MLIHYLISITQQQFIEEFNIKVESDIQQFGHIFSSATISSLDSYLMKVNMMKHIEHSWIALQFSESFKLDDIPDDAIVHLFDNIESRLQAFRGWHYFLIIHRVSDHKIVKMMIGDEVNNKDVVENVLKECHDS